MAINYRKMVKNYLLEVIQNLDSDTCELDQEEALHIMSSFAHIKLNKFEAAQRLKISTATFDRKVASGKFPFGMKRIHHKDLYWYLDDILVE